MDKRQLDLSKPLLSVRRIPKLGYRSAVSGEIVQRPQAERRLVHPTCQYSDLYNTEQLTKPAAVPFIWEHIPGRAKSKSGPLLFARDEQHQQPSISSKFPPEMVKERVFLQGHEKKFDEMYVRKAQMPTPSPIIGATAMFERSDTGNYDKERSSRRDDGNGEFGDALDSLLPEETFSMNCSVGGLSGDEGQNASSSGNISMDMKTHDFLMSRFLPAAKAMALESSHYAVEKQPATVDEPKQVHRLSNAERRPQLHQYNSCISPHVGQDPVDNQSGFDDEICNTPGVASVRARGYLPKLCTKNSMATVNQISPRVPRNEVSRVANSPSTRLTTPTQLPDQYVREASLRSILERKAEQLKFNEANFDRQIDEYIKSNASLIANGVSPYRNSVRSNISPYRKQRPPSSFREGVGFLGLPKEAEMSKAKDSSSSNSASRKFHDVLVLPPVEKSLYADIVYPVKESDYSSDEVVVKREAEPDESAQKKKIGRESIPHVMRRLKEFSFSKREATESFIASRPSLSGVPRVTEPGLDKNPRSLVKVSAEEGLEVAENQNAIHRTETDHVVVLASPLPPPLPKLPSESWLRRTLPSIRSKNPLSSLKRRPSKPSSPSAKWQKIVKSSKPQNDHKRYSQELSTDVLNQYRK